MSALVARRGYALLAGCSALVHGALLGHAGSAAAGVVLAVMIAGCLWCAVHLWRRGTLAAWTTVALMNLAMIAVHAPAPAHHHVASGPVAQASTLMAVAMTLAVVEVVVAGAVLYLRTRHRGAGLLTGTPGR